MVPLIQKDDALRRRRCGLYPIRDLRNLVGTARLQQVLYFEHHFVNCGILSSDLLQRGAKFQHISSVSGSRRSGMADEDQEVSINF
jgi:hypothetical protein